MIAFQFMHLFIHNSHLSWHKKKVSSNPCKWLVIVSKHPSWNWFKRDKLVMKWCRYEFFNQICPEAFPLFLLSLTALRVNANFLLDKGVMDFLQLQAMCYSLGIMSLGYRRQNISTDRCGWMANIDFSSIRCIMCTSLVCVFLQSNQIKVYCLII